MARRVRRGIRARRVVRRFELWSVAKLALVFHVFCFLLTLTVGVLLWNAAQRLGSIAKLETFLSDFGFSDKVSKEDFRLHGDALFRAAVFGGLALVGLNTIGTVLLAFFYNGVSGLFGGVVVSVLEERVPLSPAERRVALAAAASDDEAPAAAESLDPDAVEASPSAGALVEVPERATEPEVAPPPPQPPVGPAAVAARRRTRQRSEGSRPPRNGARPKVLPASLVAVPPEPDRGPALMAPKEESSPAD